MILNPWNSVILYLWTPDQLLNFLVSWMVHFAKNEKTKYMHNIEHIQRLCNKCFSNSLHKVSKITLLPPKTRSNEFLETFFSNSPMLLYFKEPQDRMIWLFFWPFFNVHSFSECVKIYFKPEELLGRSLSLC